MVGNDARYFLTHRLPVALGARQAGYEVHVAAPAGDHSGTIRDLGFTYHPVRMSRFGRNPFREILAIVDLIGIYRSVRPDLVHHVTAKPILYGTLSARICRVPVVINAVTGLGHVFISESATYRALRSVVGLVYRALFRPAGVFLIFQNEDDLELFVSRGWIDAERTTIIRGSGVDLGVFTPRRESDGDVPAVLFPARMLFTKGVREFVDAAVALRTRGVDARFVLAGDLEKGNPGSVDREWIRRHETDGTIEYLGHVDDMARVFAMADIACLPSYREGTPKVLLEAAACGLPIVTTDVPGCRNVVDDGVNGYLVPVRDSRVLGERLGALIEDPQLREAMGKRSVEKARDFSIEKIVERTLSIYERLAG